MSVLPPSASEALYDIATQIRDGQERLSALREELRALAEEIDKTRRWEACAERLRTDSRPRNSRVPDLIKKKEELAGRARHLQQYISGLRSLHGSHIGWSVEKLFMELARVQLDEMVFDRIAQEARSLAAQSRAEAP